MTFKESIIKCFSNPVNFKGRASRSEFWWFYLLIVGLTCVATMLDSSGTISSIIEIILFIPLIAAGARRLHDINKSGWWQLLILTGIGLIPLIYWWTSKGSDQDNQFGCVEVNSKN